MRTEELESKINIYKTLIKEIKIKNLNSSNYELDNYEFNKEILRDFDKILTSLNSIKRNFSTLDHYLDVLEEMKNNDEYIKIFGNIKNNKKYNDSYIPDIFDFRLRVYQDLIQLDLEDWLRMFLDYYPKSIEVDKDVLVKDFELRMISEKVKDFVSNYKEVIEIYNNNIKMIPVYDLARKTIEKNLSQYVDSKKSEMDRYFKSLENQFESVSNKLKSFDSDFDRLRDINTLMSKDFNIIKDNMSLIERDLLNFNHEYSKNKKELEDKMNGAVKNIKENVYQDFKTRLNDLNIELDKVEDLINEEIDSIKNTSRNFKDFISDETSIKLTDDYKSKAFWEMCAYYSFNALSFTIILTAIYLSWSSLSIFAEAHIGDQKSYDGYDLAYLSIRLIFSLLVFSSVAFTSRLASKSYIYWKKNEGIFLRLTALKSFIVDMSPAKQQEIHEKLVDVYFGKDEQDQNLNQKLKDLPNNITQLLGKVVDQTSVVLDASKPKKDESHL